MPIFVLHNMCTAPNIPSHFRHPELNIITPGKEVMICILPFFHIYAICVYITLALKYGCKVVVFPRFELEAYLKAIQQYKVNTM